MKLEIEITLTRSEDGGRRHGIFDYRAPWTNGRVDEMHSAMVKLHDRAILQPGETCIADLHPLCVEYWDKVEVGQKIEAFEGSRKTAEAVVLRIEREPEEGPWVAGD